MSAESLADETEDIRRRIVALTRRTSQIYGHDTTLGAEASSAGELVLIGLAGFQRIFADGSAA